MTMTDPLRSFASDNTAAVHPEVLRAIEAANVGSARPYGADPWTAAAIERLREAFGANTEVFLVFNGTAANVLGLAAVMRPHEALICSELAHVNVDECGAPERFTGCKLLPVPTPNGKLTPELVRGRVRRIGDEHHVQPRVVSITQSTEAGTVYTVAEVEALATFAHTHGLLLHVDGARLANAAATLGVSLARLTTDAGVDLLSFGATKNGAMGAEAVIFCDPVRAAGFQYVRKQGMQLASKMRYASAQFCALLTDELWRKNATHANAMARRLATAVSGAAGLRITQPVDANAVFAVLPPQAIERLQREYYFYVWNEMTSEVRWMTAWNTQPDDVDAFAVAVRRALEGEQAA